MHDRQLILKHQASQADSASKPTPATTRTLMPLISKCAGLGRKRTSQQEKTRKYSWTRVLSVHMFEPNACILYHISSYTYKWSPNTHLVCTCLSKGLGYTKVQYITKCSWELIQNPLNRIPRSCSGLTLRSPLAGAKSPTVPGKVP